MIKDLIEFGLRKPILNHMLIVFLIILAILSYNKIPKEIFPPSNLDAVSITGTYSGASSDILDLMAVEKIEDELINLSEAKKITTVIKSGYFSINIELNEGEDVSKAVDDVKDIVTQTTTDLPTDMDEPIVKEVVHAIPLITVAVYGDKTTSELLDIADHLKSKINVLSDLSEVQIWGDTDKELVITFDEKKIDAYGLDKTTIINAIKQVSSIYPAGIVKDVGTHYYISSFNGQKDAKKIEDTILKIGTSKLYIKDIANVAFKLADASTKSHFNGKTNISIGINKGETGDSIALVKQIKEILQKEQKNFPDVKFDTYSDTSVWIKNRLNTVVSNILFGLCLLVIALFVFINSRIALIVGIGIPTSFMIGLIYAQYLGYSLNMLSLLGALIALGMLVDEAIVVAENIYRHLEMGKDKMSAALDGAMEMYPAVLTATATTIFAFLPLLLMSGETGKFIMILPIMISILLFSSLLEAFFFLPLHAKQLLKLNHEAKKSNGFWDKNKQIYDVVLSFMLKWKYIAIFVMVSLILFFTIVLAKNSKFEFFPSFDTTQVYVSGSVGVGKQLNETEKYVSKIEKVLLENLKFDNELDSISSIIGMKLDGRQQPTTEEFYFHLFVNLHEKAPENFFDKYINPYLSPKYDATHMTRTKSAHEMVTQIKQILKPLEQNNEFEELKVYVPSAGIVSNDIEVSFSGENTLVASAVDSLKNELNGINGVINIADDSLDGNKEIKLKVNSYGESLGLNEEIIVSQIRAFYFKGAYANMYDEKGIVEIKFESKNKDDINSLDSFEIDVNGAKVALKDVVEFIEKPAFTQIFKENNKRIRTVTASIVKGVITSAEVYEKLDTTLDKLKQSVDVDIKGEQQENEKVQKEMMESFMLAIILIFIALVWMFDSIVKSLIVLSTVPLSILGVLVGHFIMGINLTMPGIIGIIGLAGVIVNDGIIMMDFIKKSKDLDELKHYAKMRLRPILLTSITTVLGLSTLMFFASGQALILQPMAISLGFGIIWATILNLYYVPMLYRIVYLRKAK